MESFEEFKTNNKKQKTKIKSIGKYNLIDKEDNNYNDDLEIEYLKKLI